MKIALVHGSALGFTAKIITQALTLAGHQVLRNHYEYGFTLNTYQAQGVFQAVDYQNIQSADVLMFIDSHITDNPLNEDFFPGIGEHVRTCITLAQQRGIRVHNFREVLAGKFIRGQDSVLDKFPTTEEIQQHLADVQEWLQRQYVVEKYIPNERTENLLAEVRELSQESTAQEDSTAPIELGPIGNLVPDSTPLESELDPD